MEQKIATFACVGCQYRTEEEQALLINELKALSVEDFNDRIWLKPDPNNPYKKTLDPIAWMFWDAVTKTDTVIGYVAETDLADFYRIFGHTADVSEADQQAYFDVNIELASAQFTDDKQCRVKWLVFRVTD